MVAATTKRTFEFLFEPSYARAARLFGIAESSARVLVTDTEFDACFGPWRVRTPRSNVVGVQLTGPYQFLKTAGPAHLSIADRGMTMATNSRRGVCVTFHEPVRGIDPFGLLRHPGLTVTVADCEGLAAALRSNA
jgi:hypothetical protein